MEAKKDGGDGSIRDVALYLMWQLPQERETFTGFAENTELTPLGRDSGGFF